MATPSRGKPPRPPTPPPCHDEGLCAPPPEPPHLSCRCGGPAGSLLGAVPRARATALPSRPEKQEKGRGAGVGGDPLVLSLPARGAPHSHGALAAAVPPQPAPRSFPELPTPPFQPLTCPPSVYMGAKPRTLPYPLPAFPPLSTYGTAAAPAFGYGQQ